MQIKVGDTDKKPIEHASPRKVSTSPLKKTLVSIIGITTIAAVSIGIYSLLQNQPSEITANPTIIELPDELNLDCDITEVLDGTDKSGLYCKKQELNGKINGNDSTKQNVIMANAEKYELEGDEFTQTLEYKIPEEVYDINNLNADAVKREGIDDEIEITLIDGDTGEMLANKTIKIHYNIDDEDVDAMIHYNVTISNITIEQVQQIIIQNNPSITEEEIEAIIQRREERIAAEKEAERLVQAEKDKQEAEQRAKEQRIANAKNKVIRDNEYSAWQNMLCSEKDYSYVYPVISDVKYTIRVGCAQKNPNLYSQTSSKGTPVGTDDIRMLVSVNEDDIPVSIPKPSLPFNNGSCMGGEDNNRCKERIELWIEYYDSTRKERESFMEEVFKQIRITHNMGTTEYSGDTGYGLHFYVPKGATNFNVEIAHSSTRLPTILEWPLTYEQLKDYLPSWYTLPDGLK